MGARVTGALGTGRGAVFGGRRGGVSVGCVAIVAEVIKYSLFWKASGGGNIGQESFSCCLRDVCEAIEFVAGWEFEGVIGRGKSINGSGGAEVECCLLLGFIVVFFLFHNRPA